MTFQKPVGFEDYKNLKMKLRDRSNHEINTGSMADIAFLLLIFFLVSTTIPNEKGLTLKLPPEQKDQVVAKIHDRNIYKITINSVGQFLIEDKLRENIQGLKHERSVSQSASPNIQYHCILHLLLL